MRCETIMKQDVAYVTSDVPVQRAAMIMRDSNLGFLPVCDRDLRVVGTLTDRDLAIRVCAEGTNPNEVLVADVMTYEVVACKPEDELARAEKLMADHRKSRIIVTDENEQLLGVISLSDIVERDSNRHAARTLRKIVSREYRF